MKIYAIDTSATVASAALWEDGKVICEYMQYKRLTHSRTLLPMIAASLENTDTKISEIDLFALSSGPGSFTGLRIGVAAVKGLSYALQRPCIGVSTLEALAWNMSEIDCIAVCLMDARREQVYNANFKIKDGSVTRLCDDRALSAEELISEIINSSHALPVYVLGDGYFILEQRGFTPAPFNLRYQHASSVAAVAYKNIAEAVSAESLTVHYIRSSI